MWLLLQRAEYRQRHAWRTAAHTVRRSRHAPVGIRLEAYLAVRRSKPGSSLACHGRARWEIRTLSVSRLADDRGHVADWLDTKERVEWAFELPEPGRFVLLVEYAAPSGRGGSLFEVEVAGQVRQGDVHATGAPDRFLPQPMMTAVDLEAGPQRLVVRALEAPRGFVMNLRRVRLVPAED